MLSMNGLIFLIACWFTAAAAQGETVKLSLYYESLCPYSRQFIAEQLYPGYQPIKDSLIVEFFPYGNAQQEQVDGAWSFTCQHGPDECVGNRIQACVLAEDLGQDANVAYIACIMDSSNPASLDNAEFCATENGVVWANVQACLDSDEADNLLAQLGDDTHARDPRVDHVPYIVFNDVYDMDLEDGARINFLGTACSLFENKPAGCP